MKNAEIWFFLLIIFFLAFYLAGDLWRSGSISSVLEAFGIKFR